MGYSILHQTEKEFGGESDQIIEKKKGKDLILYSVLSTLFLVNEMNKNQTWSKNIGHL